jgi:hypothetical protein
MIYLKRLPNGRFAKARRPYKGELILGLLLILALVL